MNKCSALANIEQEIIDNNVCLELASQASQLVFGSGNSNADVVIIGEAPGKKEDLLGQPFVGAAGKFLDELLNSISMLRKDIYITNIVKYRPPDNRDPLVHEKKQFWPYLVRQLDVIKPRAVVTLGRHAMEYFLPNHVIGKIHGQPQEVVLETDKTAKSEPVSTTKVVVVPMYHPAAALYNGSLRQTLMEDFVVLQKILENN